MQDKFDENKYGKLVVKENYLLNEDEIFNAFAKTSRKASKQRLIVQTVILILFGASFFVSYFLDKENNMLLFLGAVCFIAVFVMWFVPFLMYRKSARKIINGEPKKLYIEIYEKRWFFGKEKNLSVNPERLPKYFLKSEIVCKWDGQLFIIPHRVLNEAAKDYLLAFKNSEVKLK